MDPHNDSFEALMASECQVPPLMENGSSPGNGHRTQQPAAPAIPNKGANYTCTGCGLLNTAHVVDAQYVCFICDTPCNLPAQCCAPAIPIPHCSDGAIAEGTLCDSFVAVVALS